MSIESNAFFNSTHYKSMETPGCHSNQTNELMIIKQKICKSLYDVYFYEVSVFQGGTFDAVSFVLYSVLFNL